MNIDTITREEQYLNRLAGETDQAIPEPETRKEQYLSRLCGADNIIPQNPITREEQYLASLCGEEVEMPEPETRLEQYMAFAGGERESKPEPITRKEQLWDNYQGGAVPEEKTVSGTLIHVTDAIEEPAKKLAVTMTPSQEATPFVGETTTEPYLSKTATTTGNKRYLDKIVGGTVAWNQLVNKSSFPASTGIFTNNGDGSVTADGTAGDSNITYVFKNASPGFFINGHKYLVTSGFQSTGSASTFELMVTRITSNVNLNVYTGGSIFAYRSNSYNNQIQFVVRAGATVTNLKCTPQIFDLTLMFGSTIADYIYSLEQAEAGAGVQWLKDYGFIDDNYRAYNAGQLISCSPEGIRYGNTTHTFGSPVELRGLYKLDASNKLYCDGDELTPDGELNTKYRIVDLGELNWSKISSSSWNCFSTAVPKKNGADNFIQAIYDVAPVYNTSQDKIIYGRANTQNIYIRDTSYSTADEFKEAMRGKYLVYERETPTTSASETYPNPVDISNGDIESFIDTRSIPLPVGNNSHYAGEYSIEGKTGLTVKHAQTHADTPTTYSVTFTEQGTVYGGTVDIVTGALSITWGYISSYNGETLTGRWISSLDVYAEGTTPTTGAEVAYELASPITAELTPQEVQMLLGENYFWAENGESIELTYKARAAQRVLAMNRKLNLSKQALEIKRNGGVIIDKPIIKPIDKGGLKI